MKRASRYLPHQNSREQARRLRQVAAGILNGDAVTEDTRRAAQAMVSFVDTITETVPAPRILGPNGQPVR